MDELRSDSQSNDIAGIPPDTTIEDLARMYSREAVKRGISYMDSLADADRQFRESASREDMSEGYAEADLDTDHENVQEASEEWADSMEESGLGINDE